MFETSSAITVSTLVGYLQELVEDNFVDVYVQGELSNVSRPSSGHIYFTLKDSRSQLRCAMFRGNARALRFQPQDGLDVICRGRVSIYPQRGDLQLIVEAIEPAGVGKLQLAFDQLKEKLQGEGLFSEERKQPLPAFPGVVGVVTSATGAAFQDILNVLRRRSSGLQVLLRSVAVQGDGASAEIARALEELNQEGSADVIIVGRGGGSREDLWAFNEEAVARAIDASRIPVISAVGHETDFSISDMVADLRAPTPSAAAELVAQNRLDLERHLDQLSMRLGTRMRSYLDLLSSRLTGLEKRLKAPQDQLDVMRLTLQQTEQKLHKTMDVYFERHRNRLAYLLAKLDVLSPLAVLTRGYAIASHEETGVGISSVRQVQQSDRIRILFADGELSATVEDVREKQDEQLSEAYKLNEDR